MSDEDKLRTMEAFAQRALDAPSWCHVLTDTDVEVRDVFTDLGLVAHRVRGAKMRTDDRVDDEFIAAWQFGDYDGPSPGAFFRDSILDLYMTWPTSRGFVVVITDAEQVLADEAVSNIKWSPLRGLVGVFQEAAENYAEPHPGPPHDINARPALSFDVVLVTDAEHRDEVVRLWTAAGAPLEG